MGKRMSTKLSKRKTRKIMRKFQSGKIYNDPVPPLNWSSGPPKTLSVVLKGMSTVTGNAVTNLAPIDGGNVYVKLNAPYNPGPGLTIPSYLGSFNGIYEKFVVTGCKVKVTYGIENVTGNASPLYNIRWGMICGTADDGIEVPAINAINAGSLADGPYSVQR